MTWRTTYNEPNLRQPARNLDQKIRPFRMPDDGYPGNGSISFRMRCNRARQWHNARKQKRPAMPMHRQKIALAIVLQKYDVGTTKSPFMEDPPIRPPHQCLLRLHIEIMHR